MVPNYNFSHNLLHNVCIYLFLKSANEVDFDKESCHISSNGDVDGLNPDLTEGERLSPPPGAITHDTHM